MNKGKIEWKYKFILCFFVLLENLSARKVNYQLKEESQSLLFENDLLKAEIVKINEEKFEMHE